MKKHSLALIVSLVMLVGCQSTTKPFKGSVTPARAEATRTTTTHGGTIETVKLIPPTRYPCLVHKKENR